MGEGGFRYRPESRKPVIIDISSIPHLYETIAPEYPLDLETSHQNVQLSALALGSYMNRFRQEPYYNADDTIADFRTNSERFERRVKSDARRRRNMTGEFVPRLTPFPELYASFFVDAMMNYRILQKVEPKLKDISFFDLLVYKQTKLWHVHVTAYERFIQEGARTGKTFHDYRKEEDELFMTGAIDTSDTEAFLLKDLAAPEFTQRVAIAQDLVPKSLGDLMKIIDGEMEELLTAATQLTQTRSFDEHRHAFIQKEKSAMPLIDNAIVSWFRSRGKQLPHQASRKTTSSGEPKKRLTASQFAALEKAGTFPIGFMGEVADLIVCPAPFFNQFAGKPGTKRQDERGNRGDGSIIHLEDFIDPVEDPGLRAYILRAYHAKSKQNPHDRGR